MKNTKIFLFLFLLIFSLGIFSEAQAVAIDSATVNLNSALTVTNNRAGNVNVTSIPTNSTSQSISCGTTCGPISYSWGTIVTVTAPLQAGYSVTISGGCTASGAVGVGASCIVKMDLAKTVDVVYTGVNLPALTTTACSAITATGASSGGNITSAGSSSVTSRGVVWSTSTSPTILLSTKTNNGSGIGNFTSSVTPLTLGTNYYVRAYATNGSGTSYGNEVLCRTRLLTVNRNDSSNKSTVTSSNNGNISGAISCGAYCNTQSKYYTYNSPVTIQAPAVPGYSVKITGGCTASGAVGVAASCNVIMNAAQTVNVVYAIATSVPTVIIPTATPIAQTTATLGATVSSLGIPATLTARGIQYSLVSNTYTESSKVPLTPVSQVLNSPYTVPVSGLSCGTLYYYLGYATNATGDGYSSQSTFTTSACDPSVVNLGIDGNINLKLKEVDYNAVVNLIWTSTNASSCTLLTIQNNITVKSDLVPRISNSYPLGNLKKTTKYTLTCGIGPNNSGTVDVTVKKPNVNWTED